MKDTSRSLCYPVYVVIVFHLVKQSAKPLGFLFHLGRLSPNHDNYATIYAANNMVSYSCHLEVVKTYHQT